MKDTSKDRLLSVTLLKSIHHSLRAGRPNFKVDFPSTRLRRVDLIPKFGINTKNWTIETILLSTFGPKTTIVGKVPGPLKKLVGLKKIRRNYLDN